MCLKRHGSTIRFWHSISCFCHCCCFLFWTTDCVIYVLVQKDEILQQNSLLSVNGPYKLHVVWFQALHCLPCSKIHSPLWKAPIGSSHCSFLLLLLVCQRKLVNLTCYCALTLIASIPSASLSVHVPDLTLPERITPRSEKGHKPYVSIWCSVTDWQYVTKRR